MIGLDKNRLFASFAYYDKDGAKKLIHEMYVAMRDGRLKLVYTSGFAPYLIITPDVLWMNGIETKELNVKSNINWNIYG